MSEDIEVLLAGLEVSGLSELKRLVDLGRSIEARRGRRAELAATVLGIEDPRERLLASLDLTIAEGQKENGLYAYLVYDAAPSAASAEPIQAVGLWRSEADAFLAVAEATLADDEEPLKRTILPFYADYVPS